MLQLPLSYHNKESCTSEDAMYSDLQEKQHGTLLIIKTRVSCV